MTDTIALPHPTWRTVPLPRLLFVWAILLGSLFVACWVLTLDFNGKLLTLLVIWQLASKSSTLLCMDPGDRRRLTWLRSVAFLLFVGIPQPRRFLPESPPRPSDIRPTVRGTLLNLLAALLFLYAIPALLPPSTPMILRISSGLIGLAFSALFVRFDLYVLLFRWFGFGVEKCWHNPIAATSLADFWGNRWNRIMSGWLRDVIFLPLARRAGASVALLAVFVYSGVLHEVFSFAAGAGFGTQTLYFALQGVGVWFESRWFRQSLKSRPWLGRVWTMLIVLVPLPLILHNELLEALIVPALREMSVPGLQASP